MKVIGYKFGPLVKQYTIGVIANFIILNSGLSVGWMSPVMVILRSQNQTVLPEPLTDDEMSWILSISSLVDLIALIFCSHLIDKLGRKVCIILACVPMLGACILFIFTSQVWMLLLGRIICGMSHAFGVSVVATYLSEIASKKNRGGLGTLTEILYSFGNMLFLTIGPFVSFNTINIIYTTIVFLTSIPVLLLPESPYFLFRKGNTDEAVKLLTSLRGSESLALDEIAEYKSITKISYRELLKDKHVLKTMGKVIFLMICFKLTGSTYLHVNVQTIFELTHTSVSSMTSSAFIGLIRILASCCTVYTSDRFGRKPVLQTSLIGQAVSMIGMGIFFKLSETSQITGFLNYLPLISMALGYWTISSGSGSIGGTLCAELFDGPTRAYGVSLGVFVGCIFSFLTIKYVTALTYIIGTATMYWIFGGFCLVACLFIWLCIPETKGRSFNEIQNDLKGKKMEMLSLPH